MVLDILIHNPLIPMHGLRIEGLRIKQEILHNPYSLIHNP
jgi:hypothetical protein